MMGPARQCDFVQEVAVNYPLFVIMSLLGRARSRTFPACCSYTQELFGSDDREFNRGAGKEEQMNVHCWTCSGTSPH